DNYVTFTSRISEPGAFTYCASTREYYARGVGFIRGFILGVDRETGKSVQLVGCNWAAELLK
ncbi:MAG: hypothetical protein ACREUD_04775, partial [Gammaproteobacteria bacterium]